MPPGIANSEYFMLSTSNVELHPYNADDCMVQQGRGAAILIMVNAVCLCYLIKELNYLLHYVLWLKRHVYYNHKAYCTLGILSLKHSKKLLKSPLNTSLALEAG